MTISATTGSAGHVGGSPYAAVPYLQEVEVDFAAVATTKGSALAADDIILVMNIPDGTLIMDAGIKVVTAFTGSGTCTLNLGLTDVDEYAAVFDYAAASVGDYSPGIATVHTMAQADETLDLEIQAQSGTFTAGKVRVWCLLLDVSGRNAPGIATAGS